MSLDTLELTPAAKAALAEEGWDPEYGARPLKRAIQRRLENRLAEAILSGKLLPGDLALFDFGEDGWTLEPRRESVLEMPALMRQAIQSRS